MIQDIVTANYWVAGLVWTGLLGSSAGTSVLGAKHAGHLLMLQSQQHLLEAINPLHR